MRSGQKKVRHKNLVSKLFLCYKTGNFKKERKTMDYFIKAPVPEEIAKDHMELVREIRENPEKGVHTAKMVDALLAMADTLLWYYFMRPMELFEVGGMSKKTVALGIKAGMGLIARFGKKPFAKMNKKQLLAYADYVEGLFSEENAG